MKSITDAQRLAYLQQMAKNPQSISEIIDDVKKGTLPDGEVLINTLEGMTDAVHKMGEKTREEIRIRIAVERMQ